MTGRLNPLRSAGSVTWPRGAPAAVRISLALLTLGWVALLAMYLAWGPGDRPGRDVVLYLALMIGASIVTIARGIAAGRDRAVWFILGAAMIVSAVGDIVYAVIVSGSDSGPFPSLADPFYLAYYPLSIVGVVVFVRRRVRGVPAAVWRDGAMVALAIGGLVGALFLAPLTGTLTGGTAAVIVGATYPIGDTAVMLIAGMGVILVGARRAHSLLWIGAAMVIMALADLTYWNLLAADAYREGTWLDALWPLSAILVAVGAWLPSTTRGETATSSRGLLIVPGTSLIAATATLTVGTFRAIPLLTVMMAIAALLGVLDRLNGTVRHTLLMMEARRDATTDDLTGLPNRRGFTTSADALLSAGGAAHGSALLLTDLDGFKEVNDSLGHHAGDELLRAVTTRLIENSMAPGAILGRLGGDEFAVLLPQTHAEAGSKLAALIRVVLAVPFEVDGIQVAMTASVGIAVAPRDGSDLSSLLRRADIAMYRAKSERLGVAAFDPAIDLAGEDRLQRIAELRQAIAHGELVVHYQPKISLGDGAIVGAEALVRWDKPGHELVFPDAFLPLAGRAGLMYALTDVVLDEALRQSATWRADGIVLPLAVNLPPSALIDETLPAHIAGFLRKHGLPGSALQIEITEEALLRDRVRVTSVLGRLRDMGVEASIDDYGTGYSSLIYLHQLVVDEVKIDRSFVVPMLLDDRSASIVRSTIDLAHALGLRVVAEGIEEVEVAEMLALFGCDAAQGYHWTRPLPAKELEEWLRHYDREFGSGALLGMVAAPQHDRSALIATAPLATLDDDHLAGGASREDPGADIGPWS